MDSVTFWWWYVLGYYPHEVVILSYYLIGLCLSLHSMLYEKEARKPGNATELIPWIFVFPWLWPLLLGVDFFLKLGDCEINWSCGDEDD